MTLQHRVALSVRITLTATITQGILQAVILALLARLLHPAEFGVVAAAMVVVKPVQQILFNGIEQAGVLQTELRPRATTPLFWMATAVSIAATAAMAGIARLLPISAGFQSAIVGLSFTLIGPSLAMAPRIILRREMAFGKLAISEVAAMVIGFGAVSIAAALAGCGALSLVYGYIGQTLVRAAICYAFAPGSVQGWSFDFGAVKPILSMGWRITRVSVVEIAHAQTLPGFVGAYFGASALGQFSQALALTALPIQLIAMSMTQVASTGFRIVRDDIAQLRRSCRTLVETASAITLPVCFGITAASGPLVAVVLGPQWTEAGQIMPWLAVGAACRIVGHLFAVLNEATGRLEEKFLVQFIATIVLVIGLFVAVHYQLQDCARAYTLSSLFYLVGQTGLAAHTMRVRIVEMVRWVLPGCLCSALIYGCVAMVHALFPRLSTDLRLGLDIACSGAILVGLYGIFFPRLLRAILSMALPKAAIEIDLDPEPA